MPESKWKDAENAKVRPLKIDAARVTKREDAEGLLREIDNLAVLLHEVKKQTDRIEAAADAIGDSILARLDAEPLKRLPLRGRSPVSIADKTAARLRSVATRTILDDAQS